jgi:formylglycine-generating enzyme required for sulfatase activity
MRHRITRPNVLIAVMMIIALGFVSCTEDSSTSPQPSGHTVTGRIVDSEGNGVSGITVKLSGASSTYTIVTGTNGIYTINAVAEGMYIVSCTGEGYKFTIAATEITVDGVKTISNIIATKTSTQDIEEITFVTIPGGTFQMGDVENVGHGREKPVHTVTLSDFDMTIYEVTNAQYMAYLTEALASSEITATSTSVMFISGNIIGMPYLDLDSPACQINYTSGTFTVEVGMEKRPVVDVTWYGAKAFAVHYSLDLPTEAEWEYACRGGQQSKYGTDDGSLDSSKANYDSKVSYTSDVGSYPANPYGLYDMSGNVYEWCNDWHGDYTSDDATNPLGTISGEFRVLRGGNWFLDGWNCRSANRDGDRPYFGDSGIGFRVVRRSSPQNY